MTCDHWAGDRECGRQEGVRRYLNGPRCPAHAPAVIAGRPEPKPDPELAAKALRARSGMAGDPISTSTLNDQRAIASGKRRSNPQAYQAAKAALERTKK